MKSKGKHKWYLSIIDDKLVSFSRGVMHYSWHFYFYICSFFPVYIYERYRYSNVQFQEGYNQRNGDINFSHNFFLSCFLPSPFLLPSHIALVLKPTFREHLSYHLQQEVGSVNLLLIPKCRLCKGFHSLFQILSSKRGSFYTLLTCNVLLH